MLASPSINPRVDASIVAASAVMVVVPITVLIFATTAFKRAASASESRSAPKTSSVPLMITVGSSSSVPIRDST